MAAPGRPRRNGRLPGSSNRLGCTGVDARGSDFLPNSMLDPAA
jgi:hypothetical protein